MALTDSDMIMPVAPSGNFGGSGFGGDWGSWIIIFLLFGMFNGGWGGYGGGNTLGYDFPWLLNGQNGINANTNAGFQNAALTSQIGDIGTQISAGFSGLNAQLSNNQIADLERSFAAQTAQMQGMNALQSQLANCCCENRLATANLGSDIAREACATRTSDTQNTQAVLNSLNAGIQSIKDQICADKIEQKNDIIAQLRSELMYSRGQASQDVQTAAIQAGQRALANEIEQYVVPRPVPAYPVQNPNYPSNYGMCGCGCGA